MIYDGGSTKDETEESKTFSNENGGMGGVIQPLAR
jgi:hypothetical protein